VTAPRQFDVLVIGGGLAGAVAAKKAAEQGKRVALVVAGGGASAHASGAFDVCGDPDPLERSLGGTPPPLRDALRALLARNPHHPYALVGAGDAGAVEGLVEEATDDLFRDLDEEGLLYRGSLARNLWLATAGGRVKESAYAQDAIAAGDLAALAKARLAVVALGDAAESIARSVVVELRRGLDARGFFGLKEIVPCPVEALPAGAGRAPDAVTIARALDDTAACAAWGKEVAKALQARAPKATHVLFPAVLGLREPAVAVATLARETGREVAESVAVPPSVPGLRLEAALARVLARKGVTVLRGRATEARALEGQVRALDVETREGREPLEAKVFVLAGGRFLGGGLREGNRVLEPLFDLPLFHRGRRIEELRPADWLERRVVAPHPALAFGVRCGSDLRPIGRSGGPAFENLYAAGAVLEGWSFAGDRTGLGVALATGYVAGLNAAEAA
jgi:glycerol-3-phosphate dehydrogenase subunit B